MRILPIVCLLSQTPLPSQSLDSFEIQSASQHQRSNQIFAFQTSGFYVSIQITRKENSIFYMKMLDMDYLVSQTQLVCLPGLQGRTMFCAHYSPSYTHQLSPVFDRNPGGATKYRHWLLKLFHIHLMKAKPRDVHKSNTK